MKQRLEIKGACWNSTIAPHNFEGFFLNFGDMLVKAGEKTKAKKIYKMAKLPESYSYWSYKDILENRIKNIDKNVELFRGTVQLIKE